MWVVVQMTRWVWLPTSPSPPAMCGLFNPPGVRSSGREVMTKASPLSVVPGEHAVDGLLHTSLKPSVRY